MHICSLCLHLTLFDKRDRFVNRSAIKTKELIFRLSVISLGLEKKLDHLVFALNSGHGLVIVLVGELWASGSPGRPIERRIAETAD